MTSNEILKADMLDILFENRNKLYGAYALRRHYNKRLAFSLIMALSFVFFLFLFIGKKERETAITQLEQRIVELVDATYKKPEPVVPKVQQPVNRAATRASQQNFNDRIKIVDREVASPMTPNSDLVNISEHEIKGDHMLLAYPPSIPGPEKNSPPVQQIENAEAPIQREPEFPGGTKAWVKFLRDHLQSPGQLEVGEKKTVMINFLVAADGSVTGFEVLQSSGRIYDKEVIRVLKLMPKWKPAIQNNKPVSRSFTQPVTFVGSEE